MKPAITVRGVGKRYRIVHQATRRYRTLRDDITDWVRQAARGQWKRETAETFWALQDVSFDVVPGEIVGVVGRNGAGKSTLLKILSRITPPSTGEVFMRGRIGSLLEVGTGFHPELTGRENIFLSGAILGMKQREVAGKFDEIAAFAEVEKFLDTPVKRYSSGMYVRLAFAVAAHLETEILLIDEVLAVGDVVFQKKCMNRIKEVGQSGRTVLFVSHNMAAVRTFCQTGLLLDRGRLVKTGDIHQVAETYSLLGNDLAYEANDLETRPRPNYVDGRSRVVSLSVNDRQPVYHGEPLTIEFEARLDSAINDLGFSFGFSAVDGTRFLSYDSDLLHERIGLPAQERLKVRMTLDTLMLQPSIYSLDVGIRSGGTIPLDYLPSVVQIEVLPGPRTAPFIANGQPGVRAGALWQIQAQSKTFEINSRQEHAPIKSC